VYKYDGRPYLQLATWDQHQQIRAKKSKYPAYDVSCNQMISDDIKCPRNPIQSESESESNTNTHPRSSARKQSGKVQCAEYVSMTNAEYEKLLATYGAADTKQMIEKLDNYKGSSGKRYKSDYRTILNWVAGEIKKVKPIKQGGENNGKSKYDLPEDLYWTDTN